MQKKANFAIITIICAFFAGCVSSGTYEAKKLQAEGLEKSLSEQQGAYQKLSAENGQLQEQLKKLKGDLAGTTQERDLLVKDKQGLEESLKSTADAKNKKIGELSQRLGQLEAENTRLKEEIAQVQKQKELEVQKTSKTYESLLDTMKSEISKGEVTISELKGKLTVNLVDAVLFDSGKAEVKPEGLVVLQKVIDILKNVKDKAIRIEGHTDNVPIVGALTRRYPTNWELSSARALNVARYLQQQGIDPTLLAAVAYGEYKPVAPNDSDEGRAKNRRIEIVLVAKD
ncbi:chemotaxis protein MotB [Geomonas silvestris]|uniref:Chemotaxis protein MotB n=1 Tax=Geomonas silvestris TaxID=2740184 RepID=A0A6V8MLQ6_9BACT|nr:OmpA family protein [Geomonas silvestris]GFO60975.1 chemotaxis protein MotB [Geomonas silvestris]